MSLRDPQGEGLRGKYKENIHHQKDAGIKQRLFVLYHPNHRSGNPKTFYNEYPVAEYIRLSTDLHSVKM